ncbi:MAG: hypothetical protein FWD18_01445 [Micrococcales bacterium]|nr:hypothetical protein [Micrococcales bacterium]
MTTTPLIPVDGSERSRSGRAVAAVIGAGVVLVGLLVAVGLAISAIVDLVTWSFAG